MRTTGDHLRLPWLSCSMLRIWHHVQLCHILRLVSIRCSCLARLARIIQNRKRSPNKTIREKNAESSEIIPPHTQAVESYISVRNHRESHRITHEHRKSYNITNSYTESFKIKQKHTESIVQSHTESYRIIQTHGKPSRLTQTHTNLCTTFENQIKSHNIKQNHT